MLQERKRQASAAARGVIYVGHVPFGFFEEQMKGFFSQFGKVTRLRLSRSPKTGRSRGYAFVEFANKDVAAVAAETMHNYLMYGRVLQGKFGRAAWPGRCRPEWFAHRPPRCSARDP